MTGRMLYVALWMLAALATACGGGHKGMTTFPGLMVPGAGVGSIVVPWDSPKQTTWVCSQPPSSELSSAPASGSGAYSREIGATLAANLKTWLVAKGGSYKKIEKVDVTLDGGTIESAPLGSINLRLERTSEGCRDGVAEMRRAGATTFKVISKLYRGDISVTVKFSQDASMQLQASAKESLKADLSASFSESNDGSMKVTGGVWILEMEPVSLTSNDRAEPAAERRREQKQEIGDGSRMECSATSECSDVPDSLRSGGVSAGGAAKTVVFTNFVEGTAMLRWRMAVRGLPPDHANKPHDHCYCNTPWSRTKATLVANGVEVGSSSQSQYLNYEDNSCICGPQLDGEALVEVPADGTVRVIVRLDECGRGTTAHCHLVNDSYVQLEAL